MFHTAQYMNHGTVFERLAWQPPLLRHAPSLSIHSLSVSSHPPLSGSVARWLLTECELVAKLCLVHSKTSASAKNYVSAWQRSTLGKFITTERRRQKLNFLLDSTGTVHWDITGLALCLCCLLPHPVQCICESYISDAAFIGRDTCGSNISLNQSLNKVQTLVQTKHTSGGYGIWMFNPEAWHG